MPLSSFCGRHPLITLLALALLIGGSVAVAGTKMQFSIDDQTQNNPKNPHHIPESMDPKSLRLSEEIRLIQNEVREDVADVSETIHSIAFRDHHSQSQPILDYTTGTSN